MSSTSPVSSSKVTRSPIRIGWVMASRMPAMALASVWRAAKPTTRPSTADEARMALATLESSSKFEAATAAPISRIAALTSRRTRRRRVCDRRELAARHELAHPGAALGDQPVDHLAR